ncbi:MAG: tetratricopeptide repeat protein [Acidobacteriia bacterium]|nr:tetratricopeptide repeat protein [Terriglobia bacterium]
MRCPIRFGVLAALLVACSFIVAQTTTDRIGSISSALRAGQFDTALQLLQPELEQSPKSPQLWTLRGIALSGKGDKREALVAFRKALGISPDYLAALEGAAEIEYESGGQDAVPLLHHVLKLRPKDPTSHAMLAVLAYKKGDCAGAVEHFAQSGSLVDAQPGALQEYGACLVKLKQMDQAIAIFQRVLDRNAADNHLRFQLATVQLMAEHAKDAIATLAPLLQATSVDARTLQLGASAYEADGDTPEAVRMLRQAIVTDPRDVDLYLDFVNISMDHQSFQVGIDVINSGLKLQPDAAPLYVARGVLHVQLAQYDDAEADFEKANSLDPTQSIGSAAQGLKAVQENDLDRALATVRSKLAKKPNDPFLLYLQADILAQKGTAPGSPDFDSALRSAKKAVELQPGLGAARGVLAKLYLQAGQNQAAAEQCRKALNSDPKDQAALYHLIQALRKTGEKGELPDLLKRLAELRADATRQERVRNRYKLVEESAPVKEEAQH